MGTNNPSPDKGRVHLNCKGLALNDTDVAELKKAADEVIDPAVANGKTSGMITIRGGTLSVRWTHTPP